MEDVRNRGLGDRGKGIGFCANYVSKYLFFLDSGLRRNDGERDIAFAGMTERDITFAGMTNLEIRQPLYEIRDLSVPNHCFIKRSIRKYGSSWTSVLFLYRQKSLPSLPFPKGGAYNKGFSPITHYLSPITSLF